MEMLWQILPLLIIMLLIGQSKSARAVGNNGVTGCECLDNILLHAWLVHMKHSKPFDVVVLVPSNVLEYHSVFVNVLEMYLIFFKC